MTPAKPRDSVFEVTDDLAEEGALHRALLGERVEFPLQSESPGDQSLMRLGVVVVSHGHPGARWRRSGTIVAIREAVATET